MLTQAQAQKHANECGCVGIALPIPVTPDQLTYRWRLSDHVIHPEHQERIASAGVIVTGFTLSAWAECFGPDYVCVLF